MKRNVAALAERPFDVVVIGGGITGAGVALDAVTRGLRVALIDKGDFASGTSSLSSKLVHGGLRYLERGAFRLVHEALHERGLLLRNAPHLVQPLRFVLPFYRGARVPVWQWRFGLTLYDLLAGAGNIRRSRLRQPAPLCREFPGLSVTGLTGAGEYFDAQMDDARLALEVVKTANRQGAVVANYVEAGGFEMPSGAIAGVHARDLIGAGNIFIRARQVVNAAGPWADRVRRLAGDVGGPLLRPTKGVHLVLPGRGLTAGFLLLHPRDGRVFFVLPWLGKTLIGTTDTDCDDSPDALTITDQDVAYLLEGHNCFFLPPLTGADVLGRFVGVRPLLKARDGDPSSVSREYRLDWSRTGLLTVAGGKYTSYRHMAEVVTDAVVRRFGLRRRCRTSNLLLDGAPEGSWPAFLAASVSQLMGEGLNEATARHLVQRYGTRAGAVATLARNDPSLAQPIVAGEPEIKAEIVYQKEEEMALRPEDYLFRRTRLGLFGHATAALGTSFASATQQAAGG